MTLSLGLALALSASAAAANANEAAHPIAPPLTLRSAIARTLEANPRLQGQTFGRDAAEAREQAAWLRPPLEAGVEVENFAGTGGVRAVRDTEVTLRLGTVLELGDRRGRRVDVARGERDLLLTEQDAERLDVVAEVTRRFIDVATREELLALARRQQDLAERVADAARERSRAAKAAPAEVSRAAIAVIQARLATDDAGHELETARVALAAAWDARTPDFGQASADLYTVPAPAAFAAMAAQLDRNPDLIRFASEARVLEARAQLADSRRTPDLRVGGGLRRLQGQGGQALVLSVSMPLWAGAQAAPAAREARAAIGQAGARERAARAELHSTLFALHEELRHAREVVLTLKAEAIPLARKALDETEQGYRAGRFSMLELGEARRQLVEAEQQMIVAAADYQRLAVETERLTGRSLALEN